ncbi:MAG: protein-glutamate O-methyltransferase CheR [Gaiellaceae bacterium]
MARQLPTAELYDSALEEIEVAALLDAVHRLYGFDFRGYAAASLRRRLRRRMREEGVTTISGLQERVLHDSEAMHQLILDLSISVTSMFRDPSFFLAFRERVCPLLATYPFTRIWNAGSATGEETYSLAIVLAEEGLYDRCRIYATDINESVLDRARTGVFPIERMQEYTRNYIRAGGKRAFSEYYTAAYGGARFDPALVENVVFAQHNLVSDRSFNEFNAIVCRNVMIYFDRQLQDRVYGLFDASLARLGVLAIGQKETIRFSSIADRYEELDPVEKLYRKVG